ncbi:hypothetical protein OUZ56_023009 [Daphnia magna]|uniref:Uncharacterized protein n=1 Tax=Daphnia magna TaxID=35525 RepID=A0ABR0AY37_9CRUS|nr:hypothetical protein OUZ56_023009 [Daphnia magna]
MDPVSPSFWIAFGCKQMVKAINYFWNVSMFYCSILETFRRGHPLKDENHLVGRLRCYRPTCFLNHKVLVLLATYFHSAEQLYHR